MRVLYNMLFLVAQLDEHILQHPRFRRHCAVLVNHVAIRHCTIIEAGWDGLPMALRLIQKVHDLRESGVLHHNHMLY